MQKGLNISNIKVEEAIGIDPGFCIEADVTAGKRKLSLHKVASDEFFSSLRRGELNIDLAFLDGMHLFEYLLRDFYNTEAQMTPNGLILLHDCLPFNESLITRIDNKGSWTGDVWKVVPILRAYRPDLKLVITDCAPTGLVCVTNLDPNSSVLSDSYIDIVSKFSKLPNDGNALAEFYKDLEIVSSHEILSGFSHSLYFRA